MLIIKSGKNGPQIKKGIIDVINKFIRIVFEYFKLFIKNFNNKIIKFIYLLILITFSCLSSFMGTILLSLFKFNWSS